MSFQNTIHGGAAPSMTTSVYYTGSDTLLEGYTLCYDFNAADVNQENVTQTSPNVGEECWADARRVLVEKCTEGNKIHFAGTVAQQSDGVTGPGWVTVNRPGSICNVYVDEDCDHEGTSPTASGQKVGVVVGQYYMRDGCFPGRGAATVLQDVDRDTTNGLIMCELDDGCIPSGGLNIDGEISATGTLSAIISAYPLYCGVYEFNDSALADSAGGILSGDLLSTDGKFIGQKVMFIGGATLVDQIVCLEPHDIMKANYSTYAGTVTSAVVELSDTGEYASFEFNGVVWQAIGGHQSLIS